MALVGSTPRRAYESVPLSVGLLHVADERLVRPTFRGPAGAATVVATPSDNDTIERSAPLRCGAVRCGAVTLR